MDEQAQHLAALEAQLVQLVALNAVLRAAVEHYADAGNWLSVHDGLRPDLYRPFEAGYQRRHCSAPATGEALAGGEAVPRA